VTPGCIFEDRAQSLGGGDAPLDGEHSRRASLMWGLLVVGTGNGVGKTIVTAGIVRAMRNSGVNAAPAKPIQTGCIQTARELMAPDLEYCIAVSGIRPVEAVRELMCPFRYRPACSPHLAGRLSGTYPSGSKIVRCLGELAGHYDVVIAESVGGVLTPMNESRTMLDLFLEVGWPVLLVASGSPGTINHTLLSLAVLKNAGIVPVGVVVNHCSREPDMAGRHHPSAIEGFGKVRVLAEVPYIEDCESRDGNRKLTAVFDELADHLMATCTAG
jgi:dethiobiotin synthetase